MNILRRTTVLLASFLLLATAGVSKESVVTCGSHRDRLQLELQLHRKAQQQRRGRGGGVGVLSAAAAAAQRPATATVGDLVLMEDADGVVSRRNAFDLLGRIVAFSPLGQQASRYRFAVTANGYDSAAAQAGSKIDGIGDDDSREFTLPFPFPFYGRYQTKMFVNSDGNITFGEPESSSDPRSLDRVTAGPPRIAPLFRDLDPTKALDGIRVLLEANNRAVISWVLVPEFSDVGTGPLQTFQVRLYFDGRIEFAYERINTQSAIVAISPGGVLGNTRVVSFIEGSPDEFSGTVAERFTEVDEVDVILASQKFFEEHEDAYDYLVFYNNMGIGSGEGTVAYEITVRTNREGIGEPPYDFGHAVGSKARMQGVINMGQLTQYPADPNGLVPARAGAGDTPLTVLAHETGHLFLAFASVRDPSNPEARPMLSNDLAHWNFAFNSEASLLEGNRICDRQRTPAACPADSGGRRFVTTATVQGYSALDQYLMGFRAPWDVPDTFFVKNPTTFTSRAPQTGVNFNGERRDVRLEELIAAEGRRTPDFSVAQRRFRFAFVLVHASGQQPSAAEIEKVGRFRREFEGYYNRAASGLASADTSLRRSLSLSVFPASGLLAGAAASASVSIEQPAVADLVVLLSSDGAVQLPASVTIPAGAASAEFAILGAGPGIATINAEIRGETYARAEARIQVLNAASELRLVAESGTRQAAVPGQTLPEPIVVRVTDINNLPYPNVTLSASPSSSGVVLPAVAVSGMDGRATFQWAPGSTAELLFITAGSPVDGASLVVTTTGLPAFPAAGVVNSASYTSALSPGSLATIFGVNLAGGATAFASYPIPNELEGVQVLLNGLPAPLLYVSDLQINFMVPAGTSPGDAALAVSTPLGVAASATVPILSASPALFLADTTGQGAVLIANTNRLTSQQPARAGEDFIEIYCTGLGAVTHDSATSLDPTVVTPAVTVGGVPATVDFSGLAPGYVGLYVVVLRVPLGVPAGQQTVSLSISGMPANNVWIAIQ